MTMNPETAFFQGLIELQYGQKVQQKLKKLASKISWARGWPENKQAFWNAEAFMWSRKIGKETRALIQQELQFLSIGKNLDLGCGAYSYLPSVGFDLSPQMLKLNNCCKEKVQGDVEEKLPFKDESFDSVTAIFVLNYVQNYQQLLREIKRVLKPKGGLVLVLSSTNINDWQRQKEVNHFTGKKWKKIIEKEGFKVKLKQKEKVWFLKGTLENIKKE